MPPYSPMPMPYAMQHAWLLIDPPMRSLPPLLLCVHRTLSSTAQTLAHTHDQVIDIATGLRRKRGLGGLVWGVRDLVSLDWVDVLALLERDCVCVCVCVLFCLGYRCLSFLDSRKDDASCEFAR